MKKLLPTLVLLSALSTNLVAHENRRIANSSTANNKRNIGTVAHSSAILGKDGLAKTGSINSLVQIMDSIYHSTWDTVMVNWRLDSKDLYTVYDANNNLLILENQIWQQAHWTKNVKISFTYNLNNAIVNQLTQWWNGTSWDNLSQSIHTYDVNNDLVDQLDQDWNGSIWVNNSRSLSTYNSNHHTLTNLSQTWDANNSTWNNYKQYTYVYDVSDNVLSKLVQQWYNNVLTYQYEYTYTYDVNNNQLSELIRTWNNSVWENTSQVFNTFDVANNFISSISQIYNMGVWKNDSKSTYTYNLSTQKITNELYEKWDDMLTTWVNDMQATSTYDTDTNLIDKQFLKWNGSSWINYIDDHRIYDANNFVQSSYRKNWNNVGSNVAYGFKEDNYYHTVFVVSQKSLKQNDITLYPNPNNGSIFINSYLPISSIEIYNVIGEKVYSNYTEQQQIQNEINLSQLKKGLYFITILVGNKTYSERIIVQ